MPKNDLYQDDAERFAERMISVVYDGALVLMISIAQRTVPFDAMAEPPPSTSEQLAWITSLNECYVREWLAAMEVGRIVEHDPND